MAEKQATIYVIDQGVSTGECRNGRMESDLEYSMQYIWDKIATTMLTGLKGASIGVIGVRTDNTDNPLDTDEGYENISVLKPLGFMEMNQLIDLRRQIKPSNTDDGDVISAIVVAVNRIEEFTKLKTGKPGKFARNIVVVTDGQGSMDGEDIDGIAERINEFDMQLVVIGVDFDDEDFGFIEDDKSSLKRRNEDLLKKLTEACKNGVFGTAAAAISELSIPQVKASKPYKTFEGRLQLGDFNKYPETAMYIDVARYFRTKAAKPVSASSFVTRTPIGNGEGNVQSLRGDIDVQDAGDGLSAVKTARAYKVKDVSAPGGKRDVEREDLARGFEYGRTAVHISESDQNVTNLETFQSFAIIGFVPSEKYERFLNIGESYITVAQSTNDKARIALSSLIRALDELESYAVARLVSKNGKDPQLILLAPLTEPDMVALVDVPLPFAEDVRVYRFPPLDRVITTSGALLTKHRNLPEDDLVDAMSDYVDSMDLSAFGKDDEGQPTECMPFDETFSPSVHRINQAIRTRAMYPDKPITEPADFLMKWSKPPSELVSESALQLKKLVAAASIKKIAPKAKSKRSRAEAIKPLSGLDVDVLLGREKRQKISPENAIPEFKQLLETTQEHDAIADALKQMAKITRGLISKSIGDSKYEMAFKNMREMKEAMIEMEAPEYYNEFIQDLKSRVLKQDGLGGDRRDFWFQTKVKKLGLIDKNTSEFSDFTEQEAIEFYSLKSDLPARPRVN